MMNEIECYELARNLGWDPRDKEDTLDCLRTNWDEPLSEEEVQMTYEALVEIWHNSHPARISVDNGLHFCEVEEALEKHSMDVIVSYMDDEIREAVAAEMAPCTDEEFITRYLELANEDLIIG